MKNKTAPAYFTAFREFFPQLKKLGHAGISITHVAFDRAIFSAVERLVKSFHMAIEERVEDETGYGTDLLNWIVSTPCANHDTQNALMWALAEFLEDKKKDMKDFHVIAESLRNAFDLLVGHLSQWVESNLTWDDSPYDVHGVQEFWLAMGATHDMIDVLVSLNLHWAGGSLFCNGRHKEDPDIHTRICNAILYVWKFRKFTESRWTTVGIVCKALTASLAIGLADLVATVLEDSSQYYMHGFNRLTPELRNCAGSCCQTKLNKNRQAANTQRQKQQNKNKQTDNKQTEQCLAPTPCSDPRKYAAVASVCSQVTDTAMFFLLKDDRLGKRGPELNRELTAAVQRIASLSGYTWGRLAEVVGEEETAESMRSDTIRSTHVAGAYMERKFMVATRGSPWRYCRGDLDAQLEALAAGPMPDEPTGRKLRILLDRGYPKPLLRDALRLLAQCQWSTTTIEQGHGSLAVVHQYHKGYGPMSLTQRAFIHMLKVLVAESAEAKSERLTKKGAAALDKKQPEKSGGGRQECT